MEIRKLAKALFAELIAETRRRGERLMVVRLPLFGDLPKGLGPTFGASRIFSRRRTVSYIDLGEQMPRNEKFYLLPNDGHFSAQGAAYVAEVISKTVVFTGH